MPHETFYYTLIRVIGGLRDGVGSRGVDYGGLLWWGCGCDVRGRWVRMGDAGVVCRGTIIVGGRYLAQNLAGILRLVAGRVMSDWMYQGEENSPRSVEVMNQLLQRNTPFY